VTGTNFTGATLVKVGTLNAASFTVVDPTTITAVTPAGTGGLKSISVTTPGGTGTLSNCFTYYAAPTITSVTPTSGPVAGNTALTINGTNFLGASAVTVGGQPVTGLVITSTRITGRTPAGAAGAQDIVVTTPGGSVTRAGGFTYMPAPTVAGVSPSGGLATGGTSITITGTNFTGATVVKIGTLNAASFTVVDPTTITAVTPAGTAGLKSISVTTPGGTGTLANCFTYYAAPTITSVSPASGPVAGNTALTINGTNFLGASAVTVGGQPVTGLVITATRITGRTPAGTAGAQDVVVTTPGGTATRAGGFTYFPVPVVASVSPSGGLATGGTAITVSGSGFTGATVVKVGTLNATGVTIVDGSTITCTTPAGTAGLKSISVTTPGGTGTLANCFTYYAQPTITSVTPAGGPVAGNTALTINGTNFLGASSVTVGGQPVTGLVVTATRITGRTPAGTAGAQDVVVTTPGGTATREGAFTYHALPTVASVSPSSGSLAGGTTITVTGTNLSGATLVRVGSVNATGLTVVDATTLTCVTPAGAAGAKSVSVTTPGGTATRSNAFTHVYVAPTIASVSPDAGPDTGGTSITITGTNLLGASAVRIGGTLATALAVVDGTTLTCVTPAGSAGARDVQVTVPGGSVTRTGGFTYVAVGSGAGDSGSGGTGGISGLLGGMGNGGESGEGGVAGDGAGRGQDGDAGDGAGNDTGDPDGKPGDAGEEGGRLKPITCEELTLRIEARASALESEGGDESIRLAKRLRGLLPEEAGAAAGKESAELPTEAFHPGCTMLSGDVNLDGKVDWGDLDAYLRAWAEGDEVTADLDRDGKVTAEDVAHLTGALVARAGVGNDWHASSRAGLQADRQHSGAIK
jgi:hypothetical protein